MASTNSFFDCVIYGVFHQCYQYRQLYRDLIMGDENPHSYDVLTDEIRSVVMDICLVILTLEIGIPPYDHKLLSMGLYSYSAIVQSECCIYSIRSSDWMFYEYDYKTHTGELMTK